MTPLNISGATQAYLANLNGTQQIINQASAEVSSGYRVQQPSDDPEAVPEILQTEADIAANQQVQTNLNNVSTELQTADSALQSAIQIVQNASSLAQEGLSTSATAASRAVLAQQVSGLQQSLVGISNTNYNGVYIFSGDDATSPAYQLDPTQPDGVQQLITAPSTRVIVDASGTSIAVAKTAQEIFDAQNSDGSDATGNVFAAVNSLLTALNDTSLSSSDQQTAISAANSALQSAGTYLNQQLEFYGEAEDRVSMSTDLAQKFQTQQQAQLSNLRDADVPTAALQLSQAQTAQQAALSAESEIEQGRNLFSYLG